ncbi:unnamed protein product, partial [Mesorhabditis spiculigera]
MSCQTGIRANDALKNAFNLGKQAKLRLIKVVIKNEELDPNYEYKGSPDWRSDWRATLPECVDAYEPCFILFRLNTITEWILISFADDRASVKDKMLLAATQATFKSEFGPCYIEYERHVTDRKDLTLDSLENWLKSKQEVGPMSEVEQELFTAAKERSALQSAAPAGMKGVVFPLDRNAEDALRDLGNKKLNFVQLSVDTLNEAIKLEDTQASVSAGELASKIPRNKPRYTFFRFEHTHDDRPYNSIVFIYSLPASGSSIKERMLYSSCKAPFLQAAQLHMRAEITKKMEVDAKDDLSEKALRELLHPTFVEAPKQFAKPAPPGGASRRITKV